MGSANLCEQNNRDAQAPAYGMFTITPSNVTVFDNIGANPPPTRKLYVGGAGNIAVVMADGSSGVLTAVAVGTTLEISVKQVLSTGTTATNLIGLY